MRKYTLPGEGMIIRLTTDFSKSKIEARQH